MYNPFIRYLVGTLSVVWWYIICLCGGTLCLCVCREDGWIADVFGETPVMSTYLLAFVVSDFKYTQKLTSRNTLVSEHDGWWLGGWPCGVGQEDPP